MLHDSVKCIKFLNNHEYELFLWLMTLMSNDYEIICLLSFRVWSEIDKLIASNILLGTVYLQILSEMKWISEKLSKR